MVYLSEVKLQMLFDQIGEPARRSLAAELKLDVKLLSLTLSSPSVDPALRQRSRLAKLALIEEHVKRHHAIGDATATHGYIKAQMDMDWSPVGDETVLFCGYTTDSLVTLGGSTSHLIGMPPSEGRIGSHPYVIRQALNTDFGVTTAHAGVDGLARSLALAAAEVYRMPQRVEFLARVISRGLLDVQSCRREYLLATPLYVEVIDAPAGS
ncbi:SAVMC3_10250 family protein [Dactylosporangium sp. NPDC049525]|uniref:DUF7019 family protein n=1 Tax=Dactylosporangium sp. NPDC049525 TaxID=3154730 RepID=UPI003417465C